LISVTNDGKMSLKEKDWWYFLVWIILSSGSLLYLSVFFTEKVLSPALPYFNQSFELSNGSTAVVMLQRSGHNL